MRELLAPLVWRRHRFRATVARLGGAHGGETRLLLRDLADAETGMMLADHVWVDYTARVRALCLPFGRRVTLSAVVNRYARRGSDQEYGLCSLRSDTKEQHR